MGADHTYSLIAGEEMGRISCGGRADGHGGPDVDVHAGPGPLRVARAEGAVSRAGHPGRGRHLHRGDRARRRQRRRRHPDPGRARRRRVGHQRRPSSTSPTAPRPTGCASWPAPPTSPGYQGMSLIVVPTALAGVAVSRKLEKLGMWSSDTAELSFTDVRVPVANTIGEIGRGFQQQMVQFQAERLMTFYKQVGLHRAGARAHQGLPARAPRLRRPAAGQPAPAVRPGRALGPPRRA